VRCALEKGQLLIQLDHSKLVAPVKVELNVPERFLAQLRPGQTIEVKIAAFPGRTFSGQVYFVAPQVDSSTRTALVKACLPNPDLALKPGMFASLDLALRLRERAVVIPESAILSNADRTSMFIVDAESNAQIRPVKLGMRVAGMVELTSGLQGGERVVAEGLQKVRPGAKVLPAGSNEGESGRAGEWEHERNFVHKLRSVHAPSPRSASNAPCSPR
jgi:membrane fusion protein (multidrug efflux system)